MSTAAHAIASSFPLPGFAKPNRQQPRRPVESRHSTSDQARSLQALSHAIEYLVDSRLFDTWQSPSDAEAVHILMTCSREVFQQCGVTRSWPQRVQQGILRRLQLEPNAR